MKLIFDAEFTGNNEKEDEMLQLSIVDENKNVLFNDYFKPEYHFEWPFVEKLTGITPAMVEDKVPVQKRLKEIQAIFDQADELIGYNIVCDIAFLREAGIRIPNVKITDVMVEFTPIYANYYGDIPRSRSLEECAEFYFYEYKAHDSLNDALATLHCYEQIHTEDDFTSNKVSDGMWSF